MTSPPRRLHIIASCTDRKSDSVSPALCLRSVPHGPMARRVREWWRRLRSHPGRGHPAVQVYAGNHWAVVRSLPQLASEKGFDAKLWILSAGYGLLPSDAAIHGYSATFAYGHEDSVGQSARQLAEWWSNLSSMSLPGWGATRTLTRLIMDDPRATYIVVASSNYLTAIETDLLRGVSAGRGTDQLIVVSSRKALTGSRLQPYCVPSEAPLRGLVGGPLMSLHARVARRIILDAEDHGFSLDRLRDVYGALVRKAAETINQPTRTPQTDVEVRRYIRAAIDGGTALSQSSLLRRFRTDGLACEARRFKLLYLKEERGRGMHVA
jgi:hypothetical protein